MQPKNINYLEPCSSNTKKRETNKPTMLHKVARKMKIPIRSSASDIKNNIPTPLAYSSSPSLSPTWTTSLSSAQLQSPALPFNNYHSTYTPPFLSPAPPSPHSAPALATPTTSGIQRRRGAVIELPNEWYAKIEQYKALPSAHTQSSERVEAEPIRRAKSYQAPLPPPTPSARSVGSSLLGAIKRGKSAQAALCVSPPPVPNPARRVEQRGQHQHALDWTESLGLSEDAAISFDFDDELDQVFEAL